MRDHRDMKHAVLVVSDGLKVVSSWPGMSRDVP